MIGQDGGRGSPADGRARHVDEGSRILAGRYEVGELIGRGGMAEVHIGYDRRLGRTVAIKILRPDLARDPSFLNRFRREAQAAASLNHPAVVAVYDTGEDVVTEPTGVVAHLPFIVMEYVEGHTVRDILRDGAAVPIEEGVEITAGVLSALEYSHHAGIVHRDIKPANVMLTPTGAVKVMDFGIARALADSAATMTQTQAVIGTAQYLSPEQARGEQVDARSDLYSAGCLLFELLTGRPPFTGDSPVAVAYQHVREIPPSPSSIASDVPEALDRVALKALAKERETRYQTADEFRADLEAVLRGSAVSAPALGAVGAAVATMPAMTDATQVLAPPATATQALPPAAPPWGSTGVATPGQGSSYQDGGRPWVVWLLLAVAVLAVGAIVALLLGNRGGGEPEPVVVPNVVGWQDSEAAAELEAAGLVPRRAELADDEVGEGLVIKTDPAAEAEVETGSEVTYYVSTGPASTVVPDVVGRSVEEAVRLLEQAGLTVNPAQQPEDNPEFPQGQVTKTDPAANAPAATGATVTLYVSTGNVQLIDLTGMTQGDALAALDALKLIGNPVTEETRDAPAGTVIRQNRPPGLIKQGETVEITVAEAPSTAAVPSVVGLTFAEAQARLNDEGFQSVQQTPEESSTVAADTAIRTEPAAGTNVALSQTITVFIATEPTAVVPKVVGLPYAAARKKLTDEGFTNVVPSSGTGTVTAVDPKEDTPQPLSTTITLTLQ